MMRYNLKQEEVEFDNVDDLIVFVAKVRKGSNAVKTVVKEKRKYVKRKKGKWTKTMLAELKAIYVKHGRNHSKEKSQALDKLCAKYGAKKTTAKYHASTRGYTRLKDSPSVGTLKTIEFPSLTNITGGFRDILVGMTKNVIFNGAKLRYNIEGKKMLDINNEEDWAKFVADFLNRSTLIASHFGIKNKFHLVDGSMITYH